jgi:hypothetical protein
LKHPIYTYIQNDIDIDELTRNTAFRQLDRDKIAYIAGLINYLPVVSADCMKPGGYVAISSKILERNIGRYRPHIQFLVDTGVIECDNSYLSGTRCLGYRIAEAYQTAELMRYELTDPSLIRRFVKADADRIRGKRKYPYLWKWFNAHLTIDESIARDIINMEGLSQAHMISVDSIGSGRWRFKVDASGRRLHTNLTNLKRELRAALRYDGMPLVEIDVRASQPYFLTILLREYLVCMKGMTTNQVDRLYAGTEDTVNDEYTDVYQYIQAIHEGNFYQLFMTAVNSHTNMNIHCIAEAKRAFYRTAFGKINQKSAETKALQVAFPTLHECMIHLKQKDYRSLSHRLQRAEAQGILDRVCGRIAQELPHAPIFTIHDSVLTTRPYSERITQIMKEELTHMTGIPPLLHVKPHNLSC